MKDAEPEVSIPTPTTISLAVEVVAVLPESSEPLEPEAFAVLSYAPVVASPLNS